MLAKRKASELETTESDVSDGDGGEELENDGDPRAVDQEIIYCPRNCSKVLIALKNFLEETEGKSPKLNPVNTLLLFNCFDHEQGQFLYDAKCIRSVFKISGDRVSRLHKLAKQRAAAPMTPMRMAEVPVEMRHHCVVPYPYRPYQFGEWWDTLHPDDVVYVREAIRTHQLQGRTSNRAKKAQTQENFAQFVRRHLLDAPPYPQPLDANRDYFLEEKFLFFAARDAPVSYLAAHPGPIECCLLGAFNLEQQKDSECESIAASTMDKWLTAIHPRIRLSSSRTRARTDISQPNLLPAPAPAPVRPLLVSPINPPVVTTTTSNTSTAASVSDVNASVSDVKAESASSAANSDDDSSSSSSGEEEKMIAGNLPSIDGGTAEPSSTKE